MRFPEFDHQRRPAVEVVEGVPTIVNDRTVLVELAVLEPLDERCDEFVSVPVRSVITGGAGPSVEVGPFSLDPSEVVKLHNALVEHMSAFPSQYRPRSEAEL